MTNRQGKRFTCEKCGSQVLIIKAGEGSVGCCDKEMTMDQHRGLPPADLIVKLQSDMKGDQNS